MTRLKTPNYDLDVDELSMDHRAMPPGANALNGNGAQKITRQQSPSMPPPSSLPQSNSARKRTATTSKAPTNKRAKTTTIKLKAPKRVKEDVFNEPDRLLGPPKSVLYSSNISIPAILLDQETQHILATTEVGYQFKDVSYTDLNHACSLFQDDGAEGHHDEEWLAAAWEAHQERAEGRFDEMRAAKFKEQWGTESGEEYSDSEDEAVGNVRAGKEIVDEENASIKQAEGDNGQANGNGKVTVDETKAETIEVNGKVDDSPGGVNETRSGIDETKVEVIEVNGNLDALQGSVDETRVEIDEIKVEGNRSKGESDETNGNTDDAVPFEPKRVEEAKEDNEAVEDLP